MKNSWQILTFILAVALMALSIKINVLSDNSNTEATSAEQTEQSVSVQTNNISNEQIILDAIMTRSSVRKYTSQTVEEEKIEKMLRAAMSAPTAGNKQPWEFVVIKDRQILDSLPKIIKGAHMAAKAQLAIAVLGTPSAALMPEYWVQDCSAATENLLLAAHAMGLGAVWCGAYPENGSGRVENISKLLKLPEGTLALSVVVIGYPAAEAVVKDKWKSDKVHTNTY